MTATVTQTPEILKNQRDRLRKRCLRAQPRITHDAIAARAKCDRTLVVHFFAGRRSPGHVEAAILALLDERKR